MKDTGKSPGLSPVPHYFSLCVSGQLTSLDLTHLACILELSLLLPLQAMARSEAVNEKMICGVPYVGLARLQLPDSKGPQKWPGELLCRLELSG